MLVYAAAAEFLFVEVVLLTRISPRPTRLKTRSSRSDAIARGTFEGHEEDLWARQEWQHESPS